MGIFLIGLLSLIAPVFITGVMLFNVRRRRRCRTKRYPYDGQPSNTTHRYFTIVVWGVMFLFYWLAYGAHVVGACGCH